MAKSMRSKVKKRWRALRKQHVGNVITTPALLDTQKKLEATIVGEQYRLTEKKNAFLHPELVIEEGAEFPQVKIQKNIDLRSTSIPGSGLQYVGASKKFRRQQEQTKEATGDLIEEENDNNQFRTVDQNGKKVLGRALIKKKLTNNKSKKSKLRKTIVF